MSTQLRPPHTNESLLVAVEAWLNGGATDKAAVEREWGGSITHWNTSNVTNMSQLFVGATNFNKTLEWDTRNVTDMSGMFDRARDFDNGGRPLAFDTRNVTDMHYMFWCARTFDNGGQPLVWDTRNVTDMRCMFVGATDFNQPLEWDTRNVKDMFQMFEKAVAFDQPLAWDTRNMEDMEDMFWCAEGFNQPLAWDTRNLTNMDAMDMENVFYKSNGRLDPSPTAIAATLATSDARRAAWDLKYERELRVWRRWVWHWRRVAAERSCAPEGEGRKRDRASFEEDFCG